jgi:phosphoglycolate phosphatase-like HAD superfamily hydrolase
VVLGGDSLPAKKPDPLPMTQFVRRAGVAAADAILAGDSPADIQCGKSAGTLTAAVTYGNSPRAVLEALNPDFILDDLRDLVKWVR